MRKKFFSFVILGGAILLSSLFSGSVYADNTPIIRKWLLSQYANKCVANEASSITPRTDGKVVIDSVFSSDVDGILLPSYSFNSLPSTTTCKSLLSGKNSLPSILDYKDSSLKKTKWNTDAAAAENLLIGVFKYDADEENGGGQFQIVATKTRCDRSDVSGKETCDSEEVKSKVVTAEVENGTTTYSYDGVQWFNDIKIELKDHNITVKAGNFEGTCALYHNVEDTYDCLKNTIGNKSGKTVGSTGHNSTYTITTTYSFGVDNLVLNGGNVAQYNSSSNMGGIISALNGGNNSLSFEKNEIYGLYYYYLDKALPNSGQNYRMTCGEVSSEIGLTKVKMVGGDGTVKECYVNFNGTDPSSIAVNIIDSNTTHPTFKTGTMQDVVNWLNNALTVGETVAGAQTVVDPSDSGGTSDGGSNDGNPCYSGDLESMGWILCPTESNLAKVDDGLMATIDQWLQVEKTYYGNDSVTYEVWGHAREFANVAMVIILLVIIVSQLTGIGIDNYGIKKMLPRLIVMAILINLSFIICQVAIDLSNILGKSLNTLLQSIAVRVAGNEAKLNFSFQDFLGGFISIAAGAGSAAMGVMTAVSFASGGIEGGIALVVIVGILLLLIALVAIGMFFVSLAVRIMIVILFTALAPLAFACYVLPNTQKLFKQWWNVFKAALLVFPICGGLYGLSFIVRAIAVSGEQLTFWMGFVGTIASLMPFLLLPSLLKKSISGLGMVGEKINGIRSSLNRGLRAGLGAARNTEAYKRQMDAGRANMNERAIKRLERRQNRSGLSDRRTRELGQRRIMAEQYGQKTGQLQKYGSGEYTGAEIEEAARQNAYTETGSKINQSLGRSDATKVYEMVNGEHSTEVSRLAAAQGMTGQLNKTVAGNQAARTFQAENASQLRALASNVSGADALATDNALARLGLSTSQIKQGVATGATLALNQLENTAAIDETGVAQVNREIALQRAQAGRIAQERKTWSDQLSRLNSAEVGQALRNGLQSGDIAQVGAAFEVLKDTGNLPAIHAVLNQSDLWSSMSKAMRLELDQDMIKSGDVAMKLFAKLDFGAQNGNFAEFLSGTGNDSMGAKIAAKGSHALDGQDKDTIDFLAENIAGLFGAKDDSTGEFEHAGSLAKQIISGYTATQDGNEKSKFIKMMDKFKEKGYSENSKKFSDTFSSAISASALAKMDSAMIDALGPNVNTILASQIAELKQQTNATLLASMSPSVKKKLGL